MYPTISDLIHDLFGIYIPLPVQTFGFFMALAFAGAYITTSRELKRKEHLGLIHSITQKVIKHQRITLSQYVMSALIGALIGYKLLYLALHYSELLKDPQGAILSLEGNFLGALIGAGVAYYQRKKEDNEAKKHQQVEVTVKIHPHELMWNVVAIAAITGLLGAKIFHNLENLDDFAQDPVGALLSFSGLTFYGGLIVATVAVLYYTTKNNIPVPHMIDAAAPGLMLAYGIGRIGCHLSGDGDWGIVNTSPKPGSLSFLPDWMWSYNYPHNVINEGVPIPGCEGAHCNMLPQGVFPTPFYEVVMTLFLFGILWSIRKSIKTPGMLFAIYLVLNGLERFFIEKIRINSTYTIFGYHITQAELISFGLILIGIAGIILLRKKPALLLSGNPAKKQ